MNLLTRYLSPLRVFLRLHSAETNVVEAFSRIDAERQARAGADTALRTEFLQRLAPLSRCARCGCVVDCTHPAVTVMRKGVEAPVAACLFCALDMRTHGFKPVERASA